MKFILKYKGIFLGIILTISVVLGSFLPSIVPAEFSFNSFVPRNEEFKFYETYVETFSHDDNLIYVAIKSDKKDIFDVEFLTKADAIFKDLATLEHIDSVLGPADLIHTYRMPGGVKTRPLLDFTSQEELEKSRERLEKEPLQRAAFVSKNMNYISGLLVMNPEITDQPERNVVCKNIDEIMDTVPFEHIVSGLPYIRAKYVEKINSELVGLSLGSVFLVVIILLILYRSWAGVLIPVLGVLLSLVWCMGFIGLMGERINLMSNLLPPIIFVVGIANVIHLVTKYLQDLNEGMKKEAAMISTMNEIGVAIFLTSLSTSIGFASIAISEMPTIREFGLFAAAGVMFTFVIAVVLVPVGLLALNPEKLKSSKGFASHPVWEKMLLKLDGFVKKSPGKVLLCFGGILLFSVIGISQLSYNAFLLDEIKESDPIRKGLYFFQEEFFGIRPYELGIIAKEGKRLDNLEVLQDIDKIQEFLKTKAEFGPFLSVTEFVKNANKLYKFNQDRHYKLPNKQEKVDEILSFAIAEGGSGFLGRVLSKDKKMARVSSRMPDLGTDDLLKMRVELEAFIAENCNQSNFEYRLTGSSYFSEQNVIHLRKSLFSGLLLAFVLIGILMGLLFKSFRMLIVALIPNFIPLLFTAGVMGFIGLSLKASSSVVFVVAFGIAVDDTIHFLSRLKVELNEGRDIDTAITNTLLGTGKALILTTITVTGGFCLMLFSNFGGTWTVGLFVMLTLFLGLISDLFLMPVLVRWGFKNVNFDVSDELTGERIED